jgi:hypothetical protein
MACEINGQIDRTDDHDSAIDRYRLCSCPNCGAVLLGYEYSDGFPDDGFTAPKRVWPKPAEEFDYRIPKLIRESLEEAQKCLTACAYDACVAMCGRALEAIGRHFYPDENKLMLGGAIDKLAEEKIIDGQLHKWGKVLHNDRNLAAHPSGTNFSKQDAEDELKFTANICEYIFVLSAEFQEFEKRRAERIETTKK